MAVDVIFRLKSTAVVGLLDACYFNTSKFNGINFVILTTIQQSSIHENHNFIKDI